MIVPTIPLSGPVIVYEMTPELLTPPGGRGGNSVWAVAALPATVRLAALAALPPRLKAVEVVVPPRAPFRSVQSAKNRN
jgi:hypothetical protein